jgi:phytoene synthase
MEAWEQKLQQIFELKETGNSTDLAMIDSVHRFGLIPRPFEDMIGGMAMDLVKERYETFSELEIYCYRVAGTVGLMTLPILGFDSDQNCTDELKEATIDAALCLGLAFQLTNILRDVGEDARRGRIYVPSEDLSTFGLDDREVIQASEGKLELWREDRWQQFMEFQMARCNGYYEKARSGIIGLPEHSRLGVMTALNVYGSILDAIRRNKYNNFSQRAYVSLPEKFGLVAKSWFDCCGIQWQAGQRVRTDSKMRESVEPALSKFSETATAGRTARTLPLP